MQNRYRRLLLVVNVLLWVVVGFAEHAPALAPTCSEFNIPTTDSVPTGITAARMARYGSARNLKTRSDGSPPTV